MKEADQKTRRRGGKPMAIIDYGQLEEMCAVMCTAEECAYALGISHDTLSRALRRDHDMSFPEYFKRHSAPGLVRLRRAQFEAAEAGSIPMLIWLGKQYLGQREPEKETPDEDVVDILRKLLTEKQG